MRRVIVASILALPLANPASATTLLVPPFPKAFIGTWGEDAASCRPNAVHERLIIGSRALSQSGEFSGEVRSLRVLAPNAVRTVERWDRGDGAAVKVTMSYTLSADRRQMVSREIKPGSGARGRATHYVRCEARHG